MNQKETDLAAKEEVGAEKVEKPKREKRPEKMPPEMEALCMELEGMEKIDEKIRHVLGFMRKALSGEKEAQLGMFWKGRSKCMDLFKEHMVQATRSVLWSEYLELIQEARRVKEILDEASSFAVEQIEIAIKALEENLQKLPELLKKCKAIELPIFADKTCLTHRDQYLSIQKELVLLNSFASRVQSLRKEVIQTGMRLKIKNRFFVRLSASGDLIFPRRRELIKTISDFFLADVERFVDAYFKAKSKETQNYVLREEIKHFQELAKRLTLNTAVFSKSRKELSWAWDLLKELDKERKKEFAKKRESFKQNFDAVMEKITPFAEKCAVEGADKSAIQKEADEILAFMRDLELTREDVYRLKEELKKAQAPLLEKEKALAEEKRRIREEKEKERKEGVSAYLKELAELLEKGNTLTYDQIKEEVARLSVANEELSLNQAEKSETKTHFQDLDNLLSQKFEESVSSKEGQPQFSEELKDLLEQRQLERQESKKQVEAFRKEIGGSGLDFQQALDLRDRFEEEKESLAKIDASIEKIVDHIDKHS